MSTCRQQLQQLLGSRVPVAIAAPISARTPRNARRRRLSVELLQDRTLLSADVAVGLFGFEPDIAVNPLNPSNVAAARGSSVRISTDFGTTFPPALQFNAVLPAGLPAGYGINGDPALAFDSQGQLFFTYLITRDGDGDGQINNIGAGDDISVAVQQINPLTAAAIGGAIDVTPGFHLDDKQWIAADSNAASSFSDNIYLHWTRFDNNPREEMFSRSINNGATFSTPAIIATGGGEGFRHQANVAVAPNGDVYASYHINTCGNDETDGDIQVLRDSNGGANLTVAGNPPAGVQKTNAFGAGGAEVTCNRQPSTSTVPKARFLMQGAAAPFIAADPVRPGVIYVVANDDPDNDAGTGDDGDIVLARSTDNGATWSTSRIDHAPQGPNSLQVFPTTAVDEEGNIAVFWYDTRRQLNNNNGTPANPADDYWNLDVYATVSRDGGLTFSNDFRLNDQPFDPQLGAGNFQGDNPPTFRIGEYNGITASNGVVHVDWTGNTAGGQQTLYDKFSMLGPFLDAFETNDSIATASILGSLPKVTLTDLTIHEQTDQDFFKYTAPASGKLVTNLFFDDGIADLRLEVQDVNGNVIDVGSQSNITPGLDVENLVIPVVSQEEYFIRVLTTDPFANPIVYELEIESFPSPVPIAIDLAAADDTGMMDNDNVTSRADGTITILADLTDFDDDLNILGPGDVSGEETATNSGAAVQVYVDGNYVGTASPIFGTNSTLFSYTFDTIGLDDLAEGLNFVTAAVRVFDGQTPRLSGRSQLSVPLLVTLDTTAPATPGTPNLLASSDTGMKDDDDVTNKMRPALDGATERNAKVRVKADGVIVGQGVATSGGQWEVTVEPLDDGVYDITVEVEDLAGNVSPMSSALQIEIDTLAPNLGFLDLVEADDSGRHNDDNITNVNTPLLSATTHDPNAGIHLSADNFKYRIYDRLEESAEVLLYDSFAETGDFTDLVQILTTADLAAGDSVLGTLADGIHNLKLEIEDRAGNISHDFLLDVLIDTEAPSGTANLFPDSDTGIWGFPETMSDGVTSDMTPLLYGATEANALVRASIDDTPAGTTVALPYDGDDAFPPPPEFDGNYFLQTILNLEDGEHTVEVFFQDVAGNESAADGDAALTIFIDTEGPRITNVTRGQVSTDNVFSFDGETSVFEPKPSATGPDPLVHSVVIHFSDLPDRTEDFADLDALLEALAGEEGNYSLKGDHNGFISIVEVNVEFETIPDDGLAEMAMVELVFDQPLPDDRYTLWVSDSISDAAGNPLDGESGALGPFDGNDVPDETPPIFPTGDGEHGGDFHARFTIDSRPEIGTFALGTTYIDINGNQVFDPEGKDRDYTNRDIVFQFGLRDDRVFAGNFAAEDAASATGYDKLGSYGVVDSQGGGAWYWRLDFNHDGVIDYEVLSGKQISGDPVAGDFDPAHPGDEIGLFDGNKWFLDTTGNNNIGDPGDTLLRGDMRGLPIVGDFDGDGLDDLGVWNPGNQGLQTKGRFEFDLAYNGLSSDVEQTIEFDLAGVFERPVAADMNGDGIDDLGLFVTRREGVAPEESGEWFFLISTAGAGEVTPGEVTSLDHPFTPVPFGTDDFAQFGDEQALPVIGNFDPPSGGMPDPLDANGDGRVTALDALMVINAQGRLDAGEDSSTAYQYHLDTNRDGLVTSRDALYVINRLAQQEITPAEAESVGSEPALWASVTGGVNGGVNGDSDDDEDLLLLLAADQASL